MTDRNRTAQLVSDHQPDDDQTKTITIIVNGRPHELKKGQASFAEIVDLAFPGQTQGGNICFTITSSEGGATSPRAPSSRTRPSGSRTG